MNKSVKNNRHSIRLKGYDYSKTGSYFITICTHKSECLFGDIIDGKMILNEYGKIVMEEWLKSAEIRMEIELDEFVVMPDHFHGIVCIHRMGDRPIAHTNNNTLKPKTIGSMISGFKSASAKKINLLRQQPGNPVWQRNYYDRIIRNEDELNHIRKYIINNVINY